MLILVGYLLSIMVMSAPIAFVFSVIDGNFELAAWSVAGFVAGWISLWVLTGTFRWWNSI
ncbi:MAG: hypothetical protein ACK5CE_03725 [Actinomycetes bacterium]